MRSQEYKELVSSHKNRLFRLATWMLHNDQDAEDIVQEVFLKLWKIRDELSKYRSVEALFVTMTRNLCLNSIKARKSMHSDEMMQVIESSFVTPDVQAEQNENLKLVLDAMRKLPEQQKVVLHLRSIEGLDTKEIAKLVQETENHVRVILSRARKNLKEIFHKNYSYEGV